MTFSKHAIPYYHGAQVINMDVKEFHLVVNNFELGAGSHKSTPQFELVKIYKTYGAAKNAAIHLNAAIFAARVHEAERVAEEAAEALAAARADFTSWSLTRRVPR